MEMDKLSSEIFSILENKFLFDSFSPPQTPTKKSSENTPKTPNLNHFNYGGGCKVRILSIDSADNILSAAAAIARLESNLRSLSRNPTATIVDFFDAAAGSGDGGVLAAMLFTKKPSDSNPLFSAEEAFAFLTQNKTFKKEKSGLLRFFTKNDKIKKISKMFEDDLTMKDAVKPLLVPCYDFLTGSPFLFSRSDAVVSDGYDFKMSDVCTATCAERMIGMKSANGRTRIAAVGNGTVMSNPTAAVITHVLNNKAEFPFVKGVEDLLVVSFGNGGEGSSVGLAPPSRREMLRIAGNLAADTVDQSVAMAFGHDASSNYVRILMSDAENMLAQNSVESVMFSGKRVSSLSNAEKLDLFGKRLVEEEERRKLSPISVVMVKQLATMTPGRSSSSTNSSSSSSSSDSC